MTQRNKWRDIEIVAVETDDLVITCLNCGGLVLLPTYKRRSPRLSDIVIATNAHTCEQA